MNKPTGYSLTGYGDMITDQPRMAPYVQALRQAVRPGCIVADIGAGTGIFSLLACQMGAGHVYAMETADAVAVARDMAAANGFADRITFYQDLSTNVNLPEPADVIISDLRGVLPLFQQHIPSIRDARNRLLAKDGVLIPRQDTLWAALTNDPETYRSYAEPWLANAYGLNMQAARPLVVNTWRKVNARADNLLAPPQQWAALDYAAIENPNICGNVAWTIASPETAHGLLIWFDAELADGIGFSNAPGEPKLIYGQAFFPFQAPVDLHTGDRISVELSANLSGGDYVWQWNTRAYGQAAGAGPKADFRQSTFLGTPLSLDSLRVKAADHAPILSESGRADAFILSLIDGQTTLGDIAHKAGQRFPSVFSRWEDALGRAGELAEKYRR